MLASADSDRSFSAEILLLQGEETEGELDIRLRTQAKILGIDLEAQRRSDLTDTHSTRLSTYSNVSQKPCQDFRHSRRSGASFTFRDYDAFLAQSVRSGRHSTSFSPLASPSHSTFSLPLSEPALPASPKTHSRFIRGLNLLKLHRRPGSRHSSPNSCPHCPGDTSSQRRAIHKLPCGHWLCTLALRDIITTAIGSSKGAVPSCCGVPIPSRLVEPVITQEERNSLFEKLGQWDDGASLSSSAVSESRSSTASRPLVVPSYRSRPVSETSRIDSLAPSVQRNAEAVMDRPDFQSLMQMQCEQRDRFAIWAAERSSAVARQHAASREETKRKHQAAIGQLSDNHDSAMAEIEDKQVKAEADLREMQDQEKRDLGTALKHMEAYCAGTLSTGEPHNRTVTEQDRTELEKTRRTREAADAKHMNSVNVLRGDQSRRVRLRAQRQEKELQELERQQRSEEVEFERVCAQELGRLNHEIAEKCSRMRWRWGVQVAIIAKEVEMETGIHVECRLPTADSHGRQDSNTTQVGNEKLASLVPNGLMATHDGVGLACVA